MTTEQTLHTFNTLSDLVRVVSKLKKTYPDIPVICMSQYTNLNKLTLGYTNDSLEIKDENILTTKIQIKTTIFQQLRALYEF